MLRDNLCVWHFYRYCRDVIFKIFTKDDAKKQFCDCLGTYKS